MSEILFNYQKVNPTTWVYLSSLLMIGLFFQFNRFWSVRNLDLVLLILLAPGLLMVNQAHEAAGAAPAAMAAPAAVPDSGDVAVAPGALAVPTPADAQPAAAADGELAAAGPAPVGNSKNLEYVGYLWLFAVSLVWLVRMLIDPTMVRRPLLEPNATKGCLVFLGVSLFIFLMANV